MKYFIVFLISGVIVSSFFIMGSSIYAQNNYVLNPNMTSEQNKTAATLTGQAESLLLNKTTIPAE